LKLPKHLAIIMDGNGRWANARGHNRLFGHVRGAKRAKFVIEECARLGVENLTLFTFSTENWRRPSQEVNFLMALLKKQLKKEVRNLIDNNIRFRCIGDLSRLPSAVRQQVEETISETAHCSGMSLNFALNYGGQQEILNATKSLMQKALDGRIQPEQVSEQTISDELESSFSPFPDLIVRTSGESRLSNFFLWQAAYSEFYVTDVHWPEFQRDELMKALNWFAKTERRFGMTSRQVRVQPLNAGEAFSTTEPLNL
jgi:undecaprenyl diphosphate synthase